MPAIVPLVMLGVGAYAAHKASSTAEKAAKAQETQANRGMAMEERLERERQQRMSPYLNAGYQGLYNLSQQANTPRNPMPMFNGNLPGGGWGGQAGQMPGQPNINMPNRPGGPPVGMTYGSPIGPGQGPVMNPGYGNQPAIGGPPQPFDPNDPNNSPRMQALRRLGLG